MNMIKKILMWYERHGFCAYISLWLFPLLVIIILSSIDNGITIAYQNFYDNQYIPYIENIVEKKLQNRRIVSMRVNVEYNLIKYEHLGREIKCRYKVNKRTVHDGDVLKLRKDKPVIVTATIIEEDDYQDDMTTGSTIMEIPPYFNNTASIKIHVKEKGGYSYPNAQAFFEVTFSLEPVMVDDIKEKYTVWDVFLLKLKKSVGKVLSQ